MNDKADLYEKLHLYARLVTFEEGPLAPYKNCPFHLAFFSGVAAMAELSVTSAQLVNEIAALCEVIERAARDEKDSRIKALEKQLIDEGYKPIV
jgi:hypothetical protein